MEADEIKALKEQAFEKISEAKQTIWEIMQSIEKEQDTDDDAEKINVLAAIHSNFEKARADLASALQKDSDIDSLLDSLKLF